jgi:hypothetical protein
MITMVDMPAATVAEMVAAETAAAAMAAGISWGAYS